MPAEHPDAARARLRWAVNVAAWQPSGGAEGLEWRFLAGLLPAVRSLTLRIQPGGARVNALGSQEASAKVHKYVHLDDKKRALCRCGRAAARRFTRSPAVFIADESARHSQLLQRAACERALGVAYADVTLAHTKGKKPYLVRKSGACVTSLPVAHGSPRPQANAPAHRPHAPNWNFNVSHEGTRPALFRANNGLTVTWTVLQAATWCSPLSRFASAVSTSQRLVS